MYLSYAVLFGLANPESRPEPPSTWRRFRIQVRVKPQSFSSIYEQPDNDQKSTTCFISLILSDRGSLKPQSQIKINGQLERKTRLVNSSKPQRSISLYPKLLNRDLVIPGWKYFIKTVGHGYIWASVSAAEAH